MKHNLLYTGVMTVSLTACSSLNIATDDIPLDEPDVPDVLSIKHIERSCRHLERDLTQRWSQRSYWCIPESIALADFEDKQAHRHVAQQVRPALSHNLTTIDPDNEIPESTIFTSTVFDSQTDTLSVTELVSDKIEPCIEPDLSEYEVPAGFMRASATAGPYERQRRSSFPAGTSFQSDTDTADADSGHAQQESFAFDASAFTGNTFNPPIDPLANHAVLPVDAVKDAPMSTDAEQSGLASR